MGGPGGIQMRIDEVITNYIRYRTANPTHGQPNARQIEPEGVCPGTATERGR